MLKKLANKALTTLAVVEQYSEYAKSQKAAYPSLPG